MAHGAGQTAGGHDPATVPALAAPVPRVDVTPPRPLAAVLAVARNGAIGFEGRLPWTMPSDLARFRALTIGTPMIMGRRTYASIGRALPGRESVVVSGDPSFRPPAGVHLARAPAAALALAQERAAAMGAAAVTLIGGASLYAALMGSIERLHLTLIDLAPPADTFMPAVDETAWRETRRTTPKRHPRDEAACVFIDYVRR